MTHQPPVPQAAQSPYPLHPAPHDPALDAFNQPTAPEQDGERSPLLAQLLGIGAAFVGSAALAAWYYRRDRTHTPAPKRKSSDAKLIAAKQPYEVAYFARKHGLTAEEARGIIAEAGPSRAKANELANQRRG